MLRVPRRVALGDTDSALVMSDDKYDFVHVVRQEHEQKQASMEYSCAASTAFFRSQTGNEAAPEARAGESVAAVLKTRNSKDDGAAAADALFRMEYARSASEQHADVSSFAASEQHADVPSFAVQRSLEHTSQSEASSASISAAQHVVRQMEASSAVDDEESSKRQRLGYALSESRKREYKLRDELTYVQKRAAASAAEFLASGALEPGTCQRLQQLCREAVSSNNLEQKDEIFLEHFLTHIARPGGPYNEVIAATAEHYANLLGMQEYLTLASFLRLPKAAWIKGRRRIVRSLIHIGTMHGQIDLLSMSHDNQLYVAGEDATRVTAMIEAMVDPKGSNYLVGPCFPPDPLQHPSLGELPSIPESGDELRDFVDSQHEAENIAVNVNLTGFNCATDPTKPTTIVSAYPAARSGFTAVHQVIQWAFWRYWATHFSDRSVRLAMFVILLVGCATDSCGAELAAGLYAGIPNMTELAAGYLLLGLDCDDFIYFAKYFWYLPWAWFGDWDHALRTARRGLHSPRTCFAFGDSTFATWGVISQLKDMLGPRGDRQAHAHLSRKPPLTIDPCVMVGRRLPALSVEIQQLHGAEL